MANVVGVRSVCKPVSPPIEGRMVLGVHRTILDDTHTCYVACSLQLERTYVYLCIHIYIYVCIHTT